MISLSLSCRIDKINASVKIQIEEAELERLEDLFDEVHANIQFQKVSKTAHLYKLTPISLHKKES